MDGAVTLRQLEPEWNMVMIAASIAISLLGSFTSIQLMCQARVSLQFSSVLIWTILGSLTFGFCSIWSLHFVAMLGCEIDLPIGIDVPLTILSSILAVFFTFAALASDLIWDRCRRKRKRQSRPGRRGTARRPSFVRRLSEPWNYSSGPCTGNHGPRNSIPHEILEEQEADEERLNLLQDRSPISDGYPSSDTEIGVEPPAQWTYPANDNSPPQKCSVFLPGRESSESERPCSEYSESRHSSFMGSTHSSHGISNIMHIAQRSTAPAKNAFRSTGEAFYAGCTRENLLKGFIWGLAISSMHYVGIAALRIPDGYLTLEPGFVVLSCLLAWGVCLVGVVLMSRIESNLAQQSLFAAVSSGGVAAMHFTGMRAATFWSRAQPSQLRGYPPALAIAIVTIAISTCIAANFLMAHVATLTRNKLAEIVSTRKELWRTIAQKENAEQAAAARSDFIASASHEIRTPLHHLQGYSDLLSRTELTEEGRLLLYAIQHATKTLSLITNNVLDWSKLERHAEAACRPVSLDMRTVCESILMLLPNRDDADAVDLMVVVSPDVPHSLFIDETYIHRILMNLLSNALKFTRSGYILLLIEMNGTELVTTVKDTGSGIPPSFLPQLFEPFTQAQSRTGSQRGTGLGLSIIKQLLQKMQGDIQVESKHLDTPSVSPEETGSTFTLRLPMQMSENSSDGAHSDHAQIRPRVAMFHDNDERSMGGLRTAWETFGCDVHTVNQISDIVGAEWKYVWADLGFLMRKRTHLQELLQQKQCIVLVAYDTQEDLKHVPEIASASRFITLQKPLIWHSFEQRIAANSEPSNNILTKAVTFAPTVEILDQDIKEQLHEDLTLEKSTILLVEDNPINQKLGKKMLTALGYKVLTADDGEDAIEQVHNHDVSIDAILMDQSMPRKDGVTATREIRALESRGVLTHRRAIIALTAVVSDDAQAKFKAAGADDFLTKPLSLDRLRETLAVHLPGS